MRGSGLFESHYKMRKTSRNECEKRVAIVAALRQVGLHRFEKKLAKSSGISTLMAALTREEAKAYAKS